MTGAPELRDRAHIPALDGLRGIAILLVIPHNADTFSQSPGWLWPVALLAHAGWIGVQLFFVLSGFLITRNLLARRGADDYLRSFYGRRALRIFPLYFLTLFAGLVVLPALVTFSAGALSSHQNQIWLWTFLSNWAQPFGHEVSGYSHFWSLAVEEQFYLVWPFVVLLAAGTRLFWICVAVAVAALLSRTLMMIAGARPEMLYMFTNCRMDALALGAAAAVLSQDAVVMQWTSRHIRPLMLAVVGTLAIAGLSTHVFAVYDPGTLIAGQTLLAMAFAVVMLGIARVPRDGPLGLIPRALETRWLRLVGRYSFAMYVFHLPLLIVFGHDMKRLAAGAGSAAPLVTSIVAVLLSFVAGLLSYHLIEKHFLKLKSALA
ncbi:MAG TPA: acyltransferase [Steroidobacteraceae bacterium]|nr:acyltransferase [Steroidobacteraceae bacterium]